MRHELAGVDAPLFRSILRELIEENALASRAVLSLAEVEFTDQVPTLAVTLTDPFTLRVNLAFVSKHCRTEDEVRAVILHEFLHVLLGHTTRFEQMNNALNLALDATINAMIHRMMGPSHSDFFARFYAAATGPARLLRPPDPDIPWSDPLHTTWNKLYCGQMVTEDVLAFLESVRESMLADIWFIGGHEPCEEAADERLMEALGESAEQFIGELPGTSTGRSMGDRLAALRVPVRDVRAELWEKTAMDALQKVLLPERSGAPTRASTTPVRLPILTPRDRRATMQAIWSPILPEATWETEGAAERVAANVYLDVSGSMATEMARLIALLGRLLPWIRRPFWAFSTEVAPADIVAGVLQTNTSGGTDLNPVLSHIAQTGVRKALVVTDGYVGACDPVLLGGVAQCDVHVLITRSGHVDQIASAGLPYTLLDPFPVASGGTMPWGIPLGGSHARPSSSLKRTLP